jgi:hypothetical protein
MGRREAFDPLQNYVANRTFAFGPRTYKEGDPFNERDDMRRMRQLYDGRYLRMAPKRVDAPDFKTMTENQLKEWLTDRGYAALAHPRSTHVRLVERAQRVWAELAAHKLASGGASDGKVVQTTQPRGRERLPPPTQPVLAMQRVRL